MKRASPYDDGLELLVTSVPSHWLLGQSQYRRLQRFAVCLLVFVSPGTLDSHLPIVRETSCTSLNEMLC